MAFGNPWETEEPIRVVHLLEHTTGFDDLALREYALNDLVAAAAVLVAAYLAYYGLIGLRTWV